MTELYIVIFIVVITLGAVYIKVIFNQKRRADLLNKNNKEMQIFENNADVSLEEADNFAPALSIEFNLVANPEAIPMERKHEIKDSSFIKAFNSMIPTAAQFTQQTINNKALTSSVNSQLQNVGKVYSVKLPNGQELAQWKNKSGVFQGVSREKGGIKKYAELRETNLKDQVKINPKNLVNVANVMQMASMAVGQYYMSEIDNKMKSLDQKMIQVIEFLEGSLNAELKSEIAIIKMLSKFSIDVFEDKEELNRRLSQLDGSTKNLYKIVTQANQALNTLVNKSDLDYEKYTESIEQIEKWQEVEKISLSALIEATQLKILLMHDTNLSVSYHTDLLNQAMEETQILIQELNNFHGKYEEKFVFNFEKATRRNDRPVLAWFIKERATDNNLLTKVTNQKQISYSSNVNEIIYSKNHDVELIVEDGKLYYLENFDRL